MTSKRAAPEAVRRTLRKRWHKPVTRELDFDQTETQSTGRAGDAGCCCCSYTPS